MGFLSGLLSATVKTALTPLAVVADVVNLDIEATPNVLESAASDVLDAFGDLSDGDLI
jgi:hypothetical protein